eukprot:3358772-Amphidinium_carterae.1
MGVLCLLWAEREESALRTSAVLSATKGKKVGGQIREHPVQDTIGSCARACFKHIILSYLENTSLQSLESLLLDLFRLTLFHAVAMEGEVYHCALQTLDNNFSQTNWTASIRVS